MKPNKKGEEKKARKILADLFGESDVYEMAEESIERLVDFIRQTREQARQEGIEEAIRVVDVLMLTLRELTDDKKVTRKMANTADKLVGKQRAEIYKNGLISNLERRKNDQC